MLFDRVIRVINASRARIMGPPVPEVCDDVEGDRAKEDRGEQVFVAPSVIIGIFNSFQIQ